MSYYGLAKNRKKTIFGRAGGLVVKRDKGFFFFFKFKNFLILNFILGVAELVIIHNKV